MPSDAALSAARKCLAPVHWMPLTHSGWVTMGRGLAFSSSLVEELVAGTIEGVMRGCAARRTAAEIRSLAARAARPRSWGIRALRARSEVRWHADRALRAHPSEEIPFDQTDGFISARDMLAEMVLDGAAHLDTTDADIDAVRAADATEAEAKPTPRPPTPYPGY